MPRKSDPLRSENQIIRLLQKHYERRNFRVIKGIGDDAAVIHPKRAQEYWLVTADMLLEDVDFQRHWMTPGQLGYKSLSVNLSDIAAMGARPRFYIVSLGLPPGLSERWVSAFYDGLTNLGNAHAALLIGGDLSRSAGGILISVAVLGESSNRRVLYRSGGRPGDCLYVTGVLGRSAAGLKLLQNGRGHPRSNPQREALQAHRMPRPRCKEGMWLAQCGLVSCMMDLSDGLSADLPRMCEASGVGAEIYACYLPTFPKAESWGCDPLALALHGGEDCELLFAVPSSKVFLFEKTYPKSYLRVTRVGRLTRSRAVICASEPGRDGRPLPELGFDHFREHSQKSYGYL